MLSPVGSYIFSKWCVLCESGVFSGKSGVFSGKVVCSPVEWCLLRSAPHKVVSSPEKWCLLRNSFKEDKRPGFHFFAARFRIGLPTKESIEISFVFPRSIKIILEFSFTSMLGKLGLLRCRAQRISRFETSAGGPKA